MSQQQGLYHLDAQGGIDQNIPVRVVNRSPEPITWKYARQKYVLPPGTPTFVPYLAMVMYLGDPRAIDHPGRGAHEQFRRNEYARLRVLHGVYEDDTKWERVPRVEAFPIDSDIPFPTVMADPDGVSLSEEKQQTSQVSFLQTQMEQMANQMRVMQSQLAQAQAEQGATAAAGIPDPADLDRQVTTSRSISPEEAGVESMVGASPTRRAPVPKTRPKPGEGPQVTRDA